MTVLKVGKNSEVKSVAGAIAGEVRTNGTTQVMAIGPNAVNQAVKAIACAASFAKSDDYSITCLPEFGTAEIDGKTRSSILFTVSKV